MQPSNQNILLMEHDSQFRNILTMSLESYLFQVDQCESFDEADKMISTNDYQIFIAPMLPWAQTEQGLSLIKSNAKANLHPIPILLSTPELPELKSYEFSRKHHLFIIDKYKTIEQWIQKINVILMQNKDLQT